MEIKSGQNVITGSNATVVLESGDHLSVAYKDPRGEWNTFNLSARNLVFVVDHEQSSIGIVVRPGGATIVE